MDEISQWTVKLERGTPAEQANAAENLAKLGDAIQPALPTLVRQVAAADESVAQWCQAALEEGGPPAESQLGELIELARATQDDVAYWAVTLLGRAEIGNAAVLDVLQALVSDGKRPAVQKRAQWALKRVR